MPEANKTGNGNDDEEVVVDGELLQFREEVAYLPDEQTPFTGVADKRYENGQKLSEAQYKNDKLVSASVWKPDGEPCPETKVVDGSGTVVSWYENGQKKVEIHYKDGREISRKEF